jgi:ubiquinone/menaquinone biosynthesis C-methylase UbiE
MISSPLQETVSPDFYREGGYLAKHPQWHTEDAAWKAGNVLKMIQSYQLQPATVCEIGCGAGEILNVLHSKMPSNISFTGYEISPQALGMARTREKDRLRFELRSLEEIPSSSPYDLGLMIDVFEHVEDFYGFLKTARKTCKKMIFHIPLDLSVQSVMRGYPLMRKRRKSGHIHYFTKETALAALEDTGYRIVGHFYTGSYTERPSRTFLSAAAKLPRKLCYLISKDLTVRWLGGYSLLVLAEADQ